MSGVFSFATDYQMVVDAAVLLTVEDTATQIETIELLSPARHELTLPLNGMNVLFEDCTVAVNHHTKLDVDR